MGDRAGERERRIDSVLLMLLLTEVVELGVTFLPNEVGFTSTNKELHN